MTLVAVGPGTGHAADDRPRRHGQRPRHRPRRADVHARRLGVRVRLQLLQPAHGRGRRRDPVPRADPRSATCSSRRRSSASRDGRDGMYDVTVTRDETGGRRVHRPEPRDRRHLLRRRTRGEDERARPADRTEPGLVPELSRRARGAPARPAARHPAPCLRQRAALPARLRRGRRAPRGPRELADLAVPVHRQGRPAATTTRSGCSRCRASEVVRVHASSGTTGKPTVVGYTREDIDTWAEVMARSIRAAGGRARRPAARGLRLRAVHRRAGRALRRRAARLHRRAGQRRA